MIALQRPTRCACNANHRTVKAFLQCVLHDRYTRVSGTGHYAAVCIHDVGDGRRATTWPIVNLFETPEDARARFDSATKCSGTCVRRHLLIAVPSTLR
ncbi:hypothetical protein GCM10009846_10370 [Agrococcus versicolor]|uniref:DUF1330 domain-containing protein n=1 Tax=Agrococcus versicolor TaxID=501482 RepID=A0ABP5MI47_9MICO